MKLLIVLHVGENNTVEKVLKQQKVLVAMVEALSCEFETFIYAKPDFLPLLGDAGLYGKLTVLGFDVISPNMLADELSEFVSKDQYQGILVAYDELSNDIAVLLAIMKQYRCVTNVGHVSRSGEDFFFTRFTYNTNLLLDFKVRDPFVVSIRSLDNPLTKIRSIKGEHQIITPSSHAKAVLEQQLLHAEEGLGDSDILFACGMGVASKNDLDRIRAFALSQGFSFGVTRPVAMRGFAKISEIIGVSGTIHSPKICVVLGASGSAAFFVGIENSDFILTINTDAEASIVSQSDCVIVDEYQRVLEGLFEIFSR